MDSDKLSYKSDSMREYPLGIEYKYIMLYFSKNVYHLGTIRQNCSFTLLQRLHVRTLNSFSQWFVGYTDANGSFTIINKSLYFNLDSND
jgi:hypothetical protein